MMKIKKKNIVIAFIVAVFLAIVGFFCIGTNKRMTKADEASTTSTESFSMVGMALPLDKEVGFQRIVVNVSEDIYNKLNADFNYTLPLTRYYYEVGVYRHPVGTSYTYKGSQYFSYKKSDFAVDYDGNGKTDQLEKGQNFMRYNSEDGQIYLYADFCSSNYKQEYSYTIVFCKIRQDVRDFDWKNTSKNNIYMETQSRSVAWVAEQALDDTRFDWTDEEKNILNWYRGISSANGETYDVVLIYKTMDSFGFVEEKSSVFEVDGTIIDQNIFVFGDISKRMGYNHLSGFDCIYYDENTGDAYTYLKANGYTYNFDTATEMGTLTITYRDFAYQDFALFIQDNDTEDEIDYTYVMRTTNRNFSETEDGVYCLTYEYADMSTVCFRAFGWLVEFSADNFTYTIPSGVDVVVNPTATSLQIYFDPENEIDLSQVFVYVNAEIIPDYECDVEIVYKDFIYDAGAITYDEVSKTFTMWYSEMVALKLKGAFADSDYFQVVENGLKLYDEAFGIEFSARYAEFNGVSVGEKQTGEDRPKYIMTVEYTYNTLLQLYKYVEGELLEVSLLEVNPYSRYVYLDVNKSKIYQGRLSNMVLISDESDASLHADYEYLENSYVKYLCGAHEEKVISVGLYYTDTFLLEINYFEQYYTAIGNKATPFATLESKKVEVKMSEYDLNNITIADIKKFLGKNDLSITGLVVPGRDDQKAQIDFSNPQLLMCRLTYGTAQMNNIDVDGEMKQQNVGLMNFSAFAEKFIDEDNVNVQMLNNEDSQGDWYLTSNEISADKLYGLFVASSFLRDRTNINTVFSNCTHGGTQVVFSEKQVKGSRLYQALNELEEETNPFFSAVASCVLNFCEIVNDENKTYDCVYSFLDGTMPYAYVSMSGADDAYDDDNAMENAGQDVADSINQSTEEFLKELKEIIASFKPFDTDKLGFIFGTVGILAVVGILIFAFTRNNKPPKRKK